MKRQRCVAGLDRYSQGDCYRSKVPRRALDDRTHCLWVLVDLDEYVFPSVGLCSWRLGGHCGRSRRDQIAEMVSTAGLPDRPGFCSRMALVHLADLPTWLFFADRRRASNNLSDSGSGRNCNSGVLLFHRLALRRTPPDRVMQRAVRNRLPNKHYRYHQLVKFVPCVMSRRAAAQLGGLASRERHAAPCDARFGNPCCAGRGGRPSDLKFTRRPYSMRVPPRVWNCRSE